MGGGNNTEEPAVIPVPPPQPDQPAGPDQQAAAEHAEVPGVRQVKHLVRSGLPFLWKGDSGDDGVQTQSIPTAQPEPVRQAPTLVRAGLPFLWGSESAVQGGGERQVEDCPLYLQGICPHGISGKSDGGCQRQHRKRCLKFMKWGNKGENGCKVKKCDRAHPVLCVRSLDLKCYVKECPNRLHTLKCKRSNAGAAKPGPGQHRAAVGDGDIGQPHRGGQQQGAGHQPPGGPHQVAGARPAQGQRDGGGYRRNGRESYPGHATGWKEPYTQRRNHPVGDKPGGRHAMEQDFHMVTAQQLLGAIQEMVKQVLDQGHQLPEQGLGGRPSC